jgi:hypothetical protein
VFVLGVIVATAAVLAGCGSAQTPSTGALVGDVLDPSDKLVPGAVVTLTSQDTGESTYIATDELGRFGFLLIAPGRYQLCTSKTGFARACSSGINIDVAETRRLEIRLYLAGVVNSVQVPADPPAMQTSDSSLGRFVTEEAIRGLPLVTRNFTQIVILSSGVIAGVSNAGELGLGGSSLSQTSKSSDGIFVHGMRSYDNNWQLDGVSVSDVQGSGSASGGIPIPNPDTIQEFRVQTGLYDAAYGRYPGANVSVVTKSGGNDFHGEILEFFRNDELNANDFFRNRTAQPRAALKQNQYGLVGGGPIVTNRMFFFGSYQGTRQVNGLAAGQARIACTASLSSPPITDGRTPAALGVLFAGMAGKEGGVAVRADGSNINPVALQLLNFKLPDGTFLIPTPQTTNPSKPFVSQGFSVFSEACQFNEDQFLVNMDYVASPKNKISGHLFLANDAQTVAFPGNRFNSMANIRGFSSPSDHGFRVLSLADTYAFDKTWLNDARVGFVRSANATVSRAAFKWSDVGVTESDANEANEMPNLNILGSVAFSSAFPLDFAQNSFSFSDDLSSVRGPHAIHLGGSLTRFQDNHGEVGLGSFVQFLSWPDFLLGLDATANGTNTFSNVFASDDYFGLFNRDYRAWEGSAFGQDDYRISRPLTLNIGIRYERLGQFADKFGRNSGFNVGSVNPNPPPGGSLAGYVVASNFTGVVPSGVQRAGNEFANEGIGQNTIAPRVGFVWQVLPGKSPLLLRTGYGIYFSRPTGQVFYQTSGGAPFALPRMNTGAANTGATFQSPFPQPFPTAASFPLFPPYSPTTHTSILTVSPRFRPAVVQQYSLNLQAGLGNDWLLDAGYVRTLGKHLQRLRSLNQAMLSSSRQPIRGTMANTVANISQRVPILGIPADSLQEVESEGSSVYNALEVSVTKRPSFGLQFLASYTFSKALDSDGADINGTSAGTVLTLGDQNSSRQRWGRASFNRTQRFIFSGVWSIPVLARWLGRPILGGWMLAAISTIQSGSAVTIADTNSANIFGISEDRTQLTGKCTKNQLVESGSLESKLNGYFDPACFTSPPVIGSDGIGTSFGNSATGLVDGPGQANLDLAISKTVSLHRPREKGSLIFRAEFFNALNHPQFANPDSNFTSPTFGLISSTAVNPRVAQLAMKLTF